MAVLETILYPIIIILRLVLESLNTALGTYGLAIIGLSLFVAVVTYPISLYTRRVELRSKERHEAMAPEIAEAKATFKGEERFNAIDAVYQKHNYHPIMSITGIFGFALQLPFLLSSLVLLIAYPPLQGVSFLFIDDLSKSDQLISVGGWSLNALPFLMTGLTLMEAAIKPELDLGARRRFAIVALGLLILVYLLPAAVIIYWSSSNVWSLLRCIYYRSKMPKHSSL